MSIGFDFKKRIGVGHFGEVWLVIDKGLNTERALKIIQPSKISDDQSFFKEAQLLKETEHYNIVRVAETGRFKDGRIYVAMEYLKRGSIEDESQGGFVPITRAQKIIIDVLRGLEYAHAKGILHRDIKPANILIGNNDEGKLSDFGLAVKTQKGVFIQSAREYLYIIHLAPEIMKSQTFTVSSDIYAVGITFYRLINGDSYLPAVEIDDIKKMIRRGEYPDRTKYRMFVPLCLRRFIHQAIDLEPRNRYKSARSMRRALERIDIKLDWEEENLENKTIWESSSTNKYYKVELGMDKKKKWYINVEKGSSRSKLRKIRKLCQSGLSEKVAFRKCSRMLQDFTIGKIK